MRTGVLVRSSCCVPLANSVYPMNTGTAVATGVTDGGNAGTSSM